MSSKFCFNAVQLEDLYYYNRTMFKEFFNNEMKSFTIHCSDTYKSLNFCAWLACYLKRHVYFEYIDTENIFRATFYDNDNTEPEIDLFDLMQEHFNKPNFWDKYNIDEKYNYIVVDYLEVKLFINQPSFHEFEGWYFLNDDDTEEEPLILEDDEISYDIENYLFLFSTSLKIIKRPKN